VSEGPENREQENVEAAAPAAEQAQAPAQAQQPRQLVVDASKATALYSNFCRVTGTPEELIIDFGLNSQPMGVPTAPIEVTQRIIVNYFTAKRMLAALQMSLARHEAAFGVLETDVQKRVRPGVLRQPTAQR
jgi:hypothetical protein